MYLIFDTETTGLPKNWRAPITDVDNWPRVVQLAWQVRDDKHEIVAETNLIVRPDGFKIPKEVAKIHGITQEIALEKGLPIAEVLATFLADLQNAKYVIAHNLDYDQKVASAEYLRLPASIPFKKQKLICTKVASTDYCKLPGNYGYKWPTLPELYMHLFKRDFEGAHDALVDVRATSECFFELLRRNVVR